MEAFGGVGTFEVEMLLIKWRTFCKMKLLLDLTIQVITQARARARTHIRAAGLPLGSPVQSRPCVMYNPMGEPGEEGTPFSFRADEILSLPEVSLTCMARKKLVLQKINITVTAENVDKAVEVTEKLKAL